MKTNADKRVEAVMSSMDGIRAASSNPFLWTKIEARLREPQPWLPAAWAWRLTVAMAIIAILNLLTIVRISGRDTGAGGAGAVATEYSISLPQSTY